MSDTPQEELTTMPADYPAREPAADTPPDPPPPKGKPAGIGGVAIFIILILGLCGVLTFINGFDSGPDVDIQQQDAEIRARAAAENPYASFRAVINDCLMCGTNNPYGGWETEDGRTLVLNEPGSFVALFEDGTSMRGDWTLDDGELCLLSASGGRTCFRHEQKIDAMTLDDALYIRQ